MGIIKAIKGAIGGTLADQWLEVIEPSQMSDTTVFAKGAFVRQGDGRGSNKKSTGDVITDGSVIHVYDNQFMLLVDGGKIVDYSGEPGYYEVSNSSAPSLFNGGLDDAVQDSFNRVKFGGVPSGRQQVFYINTQEIKGIKFGTRTAINYFDSFYNAELFLRAHGTYSIRIVDPVKFYQEAIPRNATRVDIRDINEQYLSEFLEALQSAINQLSADGERISFVSSKGRELSRYMSTALDPDWKAMRGIEVQSVGIASISYDETSQDLINYRNKGAMLSDPAIREGYVQGSVARGVEAAGSNAGGAMVGFMGVNMGMQGGGIAGFSQANQAQMQQQAQKAADGWQCACGHAAHGKFCPECGKPKPSAADGWQCSCGHKNPAGTKFCPECGGKRPEARACPKCGQQVGGSQKFCPECGAKLD